MKEKNNKNLNSQQFLKNQLSLTLQDFPIEVLNKIDFRKYIEREESDYIRISPEKIKDDKDIYWDISKLEYKFLVRKTFDIQDIEIQGVLYHGFNKYDFVEILRVKSL